MLQTERTADYPAAPLLAGLSLPGAGRVMLRASDTRIEDQESLF